VTRLRDPGEASATERGFALITVLWATMILAAILASLLATGRSESRLAHTHYVGAQLDAAADGAINLAILRMLDRSADVRPRVDATPFALDFAGYRVVMTVQDEAGKIDLNTAGDELLRRLLLAVGLDHDSVRPLLENIIAWRQRANVISPRASVGDGAPRVTNDPRASAFRSVDELRLVQGVTPALFRRLAASLTVYSQTPGVDPASAPTDVLSALSAMGGRPVVEVLAARNAGQIGGVLLGHAFTIRARIDLPEGQSVLKTAIIRLPGTRGAMITVFQWD